MKKDCPGRELPASDHFVFDTDVLVSAPDFPGSTHCKALDLATGEGLSVVPRQPDVLSSKARGLDQMPLPW